jgi:Subtilase family
MAAPRNRRHLFVESHPQTEAYTPHLHVFDSPRLRDPEERPALGQRLRAAFESAVSAARQRRARTGIEIEGAEPGIYVQFESEPGVSLDLQSLEDKRQRIELVAVTHFTPDGDESRRIERATVFVPEGKVNRFINRFDAYSKTEQRAPRERRYENMLDPVATLRLATLKALWTDDQSAYPEETQTIWWEVWLRRHNGQEVERVYDFAQQKDIAIGTRRLQFDDRIVMLMFCSPSQLSASIDVLNDFAEVRKAKDAAGFFVDLDAIEQASWLADLHQRTTHALPGSPAVCILDTGVTNGDPLLAPALAASDCHACEQNWGTHDHDGHGTLMAGLALYGDLVPLLASSHPVHLRHQLESVKILPPSGSNSPELYGSITADAISRVEIQAPNRKRSFSMAVTATDRHDRGEPTSWSAAIDALAAGRSFDSHSQGLVYIDDPNQIHQRLIIISAGNVDGNSIQADHLVICDLEPIQDPAQSWNALTVGAYTDKITIQDPTLAGWGPVAIAGELSPYSATGVSLGSQWPTKPDVVFEGGNAIRNAQGTVDFQCVDLSLLSTNHQPAQKSFAHCWATSAATALAANMASQIAAEYPALWPETIRGLIVHSAEWTPQMKAQLATAANKTARARLIRRYGFGVPDISRALRSANDSLTLINQGTIHPFANGSMREMHLFALPWPTQSLQLLEDVEVRLRITLSYFIEPNPARIGWKRRHRYASHSLRFDVRGPTETTEDFHKRLNQRALADEEERPSGVTVRMEEKYTLENSCEFS